MSDKESKGTLGEILRTVVSTGVTAASMGEEAVKGMVGNAKSAKTEILGQVKGEIKNWLEKIDLSKEIDRVLRDYDMEVSAKISFKKKPKTDEEK